MQQQHRSVHLRWGGLPLLVGILLVIGLVIGLVEPAYATDFRSGDTVVIGADEVIEDDLFVTGETVTIDGIVRGDLFATGATVTVNGQVEGSLLISGRTLVLDGTVNGSTYAGGYSLTLGETASVGRNLYFGGYSLDATAGSTIGRSLYGGGYQLLLNGSIEQDATVSSAALEVNGTVAGDLHGNVGSTEESAPPTFMPEFEGAVAPVAPGLRISPDAQIGGTLDVETTLIEPDAPPPPYYSLENLTLRWAIGEFLSLLIIGLLLFYLRPSWLRNASTALRQRPFPSLGVGLLTVVIVVVGTPIAIGLMVLLALLGGLLTLGQLTGDILGVGIPTLIFALTLFFFVAGIVTKIVVAYLGGNWLFRQANSERPNTSLALIALVFGLLVYIGLRLIPFGIGTIIGLIITLFGLGAIYFAGRSPRSVTSVTPPLLPVTQRDVVA